MAKVISLGFADTSITEVPKLMRGKLNFAADWRPTKDTGAELHLVNLTGPSRDRQEEIMLQCTPVADIYSKTSISPDTYGPSKKGVNVYSRISDVVEVTEAGTTFLERHPISVSIVIRCSQSEYISADLVQTMVARAVSTLYDTGSETTTRLNAILRGSLKPSGI